MKICNKNAIKHAQNTGRWTRSRNPAIEPEQYVMVTITPPPPQKEDGWTCLKLPTLKYRKIIKWKNTIVIVCTQYTITLERSRLVTQNAIPSYTRPDIFYGCNTLRRNAKALTELLRTVSRKKNIILISGVLTKIHSHNTGKLKNKSEYLGLQFYSTWALKIWNIVTAMDDNNWLQMQQIPGTMFPQIVTDLKVPPNYPPNKSSTNLIGRLSWRSRLFTRLGLTHVPTVVLGFLVLVCLCFVTGLPSGIFPLGIFVYPHIPQISQPDCLITQIRL
jgi:hypothetical protein